MAPANNGVLAQLERKAAISVAGGPGSGAERHSALRQLADTISRKNIDKATCEYLNEAHSRLIMLCYEKDDTGRLCNVDSVTGKVLIPLPWGKKGYAKWGLAPSEADTFRRIMFFRQRSGVPLFFFDSSRRSWFLSLQEYPVLPVVAEWNIAVGEYRAFRSG